MGDEEGEEGKKTVMTRLEDPEVQSLESHHDAIRFDLAGVRVALSSASCVAPACRRAATPASVHSTCMSEPNLPAFLRRYSSRIQTSRKCDTSRDIQQKQLGELLNFVTNVEK